jgi:hypothetical protein
MSPMSPVDLADRRYEALARLQKMSRKRRKLLGRFIDDRIGDIHHSSQLMLVLADLRQFCELPGELDGKE